MLRRGSRSGAEVLRSENDKEEAFEANGEIAILTLAQDSKNPARTSRTGLSNWGWLRGPATTEN